MKTESELRHRVVDPLPDLEAEREIDFGGLGRKIARRWWLVAAAVAVGAVIGYLASLGGGDVYVARTTVYLGQPTTPGGGGQVQSLATNPSTVTEIVTSESVVQEVAREVGVDPDRLRQGISSRPLTSSTQPAARPTQSPLVQISVRGPWRVGSARAANLLAAAVIEEVSRYVVSKMRALESRLASHDRQLREIERTIEAHERALAEPGLTSLQELSLLNLMALAEQRRGALIEARTGTEQLIMLAEEVERAGQVTEAAAARVPAQSPRTAIVVGAIIGLLAGLALTLLPEPLLGRRRLRS